MQGTNLEAVIEAAVWTKHHLILWSIMEHDNKAHKWIKQSRCYLCWETGRGEINTRWKCSCGKSVCHDHSKKDGKCICFTEHINQEIDKKQAERAARA